MDSQAFQKPNSPKALYFYNIILCGHHETNKNVILQNYKNTQNHSDLGVSYSEYKNEYNDYIDTLQIWNVPNKEEYENLILTQSNSIDGIFIVYDRSNEDTLININRWMKLITFHQNSVKILISTNPKGLPSKINSSNGRAIAKYYGFNYYKTLSAQNNIMEDLLKILRNKKYNNMSTNSQN